MSTSARHPPAAYASASARAHPYSAPAHRAPHHRRPSPPRDDELFPPSPPRSHHDAASPPVQKATTVDANDNYWDDVPPAPASLKSILDSFRRSGEGDRDLLMAILQAKKSEEERLTAIIQTRLTILQARLNMAAIQAQMPPPPDAFPPFNGQPGAAAPTRQERTPSLSASSSSSTNSPPAPAHAHPQYYQQFSHGPERIHLPPPSNMYNDRLPPLREHSREHDVRDVRDRREHRERERERDTRDTRDTRDRRERQPPSPREAAGGLEMLLEGVREAERKERV